MPSFLFLLVSLSLLLPGPDLLSLACLIYLFSPCTCRIPFSNLATFALSDSLLQHSLVIFCGTEGVVAGDKHLKTNTYQGYRKRHRPPKRQPKLPQAPISGYSTMFTDPDRSLLPSASSAPPSNRSVAQPSPDARVSHQLDRRFYTLEENVKRSQHASDIKCDLENKLATEQKLKILNVNLEDNGNGGTSM